MDISQKYGPHGSGYFGPHGSGYSGPHGKKNKNKIKHK